MRHIKAFSDSWTVASDTQLALLTFSASLSGMEGLNFGEICH